MSAKRAAALAAVLAFLAGQAWALSVAVSGGPAQPVKTYHVGSHYFLSAKKVASLYRADIYWRPVSRWVELACRGRLLRLRADSRIVQVDGRRIVSDQPVLWRASEAWIPVSLLTSRPFSFWAGTTTSFDASRDLLSIGGTAESPPRALEKRPSLPPPRLSAVRRPWRVVIDAGHGGRDPGARGLRGTLEKDVNLEAALELEALLKKDGIFDVRMTRDNDVFVPLEERSRIANAWGADLFISIHSNASTDPRESGFETYFLSEHASDPRSRRLAEFENSSLKFEGNSRRKMADILLSELSKTETINAAAKLAGFVSREVSGQTDLADRGVKQAGFYVLRGTHAPSILFEMGYLTNERDEKGLRRKSFRERILRGISAGIVDYARESEHPHEGS